MSFWTDVENHFNAAIKDLGHQLQGLVTFIKPLAIAGAEEVAHVAFAAVLAEAPKVISGQEKLNNATAHVVDTLAKSSKAVLASVAQTAVQTAYNLISAQLNK